MKIKIHPSRISGTVAAPPSKSFAHRLIIAACLSGGRKRVKNTGDSKDVRATVRALTALGADCALSGGDFVTNGFSVAENAVADCGESGSTLRFLIPVAAALGADASFTGTEKLLGRPCGALIDCLKTHGVSADGFKFAGRLSGGTFVIDGGISSQYITGLLFAAPLTGQDCEIVVTGKEVSKPYIEITLAVLEKSGITVKRTKNGFFIPKGQKYALPNVTETEGDWSGAAFTLAAGAIGGSVTVTGLNPESIQGDRKIAEILSRFGASVTFSDGAVTAKPSGDGTLKGLTVDCAEIPDLAQIIAVTAAFAQGKTVLLGTENLKHKESDRTAAIINTLAAAGIKAETDGRSITVYGGAPKGFTADSGNDHRTAMSAAVLAAYSDGESVIDRAEAVDKSYPAFYEDMKKTGGIIDVLI